jgi:hypothetical protein
MLYQLSYTPRYASHLTNPSTMNNAPEGYLPAGAFGSSPLGRVI